MTKTSKSQLKELVDQFCKFGAQLIVFDSTCSDNNVTGQFQFTCQFTKTKDGKVFEGTELELSINLHNQKVTYFKNFRNWNRLHQKGCRTCCLSTSFGFYESPRQIPRIVQYK